MSRKQRAGAEFTIEDGESFENYARRIAYYDPGVPFDLMIYRLRGNRVPTGADGVYLTKTITDLVEAGWLRETSEGHVHRLYLAVPICACGDSIYNGWPCPDESTQTEWPCHGLRHCPARIKAGIDR